MLNSSHDFSISRSPSATVATRSPQALASRRDTPHAFLILDLHGQILFANPETAPLLRTSTPLIGQEITQFIPELPLQSNTSGYNLAYAYFIGADPFWQAFAIQGQHLELRLQSSRLGNNSFITLEMRTTGAQACCNALQNLMRRAESSSDIVITTHLNGEIEYANRAFEQATGYSRTEVQGLMLQSLDFEEIPERHEKMWATLRAGKTFHGMFVSRRKNGKALHVNRHGRVFLDAESKPFRYIFNNHDISDRELALQRLRHQANHDALTGLPNRHLLLDRLQQARTHAIRNKSGFTLLLLDMDHLKLVNDQLGHAVGDALLITMAERLRNCVREEDTVSRLGGDEFAIILSHTATPKDAGIALDKILQELRKPLLLDGDQLSVNASIGAALFPDDSLRLEELLNLADAAMYHAKQQGGDRYRFHRPSANIKQGLYPVSSRSNPQTQNIRPIVKQI